MHGPQRKQAERRICYDFRGHERSKDAEMRIGVAKTRSLFLSSGRQLKNTDCRQRKSKLWSDLAGSCDNSRMHMNETTSKKQELPLHDEPRPYSSYPSPPEKNQGTKTCLAGDGF